MRFLSSEGPLYPAAECAPIRRIRFGNDAGRGHALFSRIPQKGDPPITYIYVHPLQPLSASRSRPPALSALEGNPHLHHVAPTRDLRRALYRSAVGSKEGGSSYARGALMPRGWRRDRAEPRHCFREGSGSSAAGTAAAAKYLGLAARFRHSHQVRLFSDAPCQHFSFSFTEYWAPPSEMHPTGNFSPSIGSRQVPRSVRNALCLSPGVRPSAGEKTRR